MPDGYRETIEKGMSAVRYFDGTMSRGNGTRDEQLARLKREIATADAVVIGAGAGLSTSAGFIYTGERFHKYFDDFAKKYCFHDMYAGGFYPYQTLEENWAYWSRYIYINRYVKPPKQLYDKLYELVDGRVMGDAANQPKKDYFIITTNVDHQFQKAGFVKKRLFYTQGDYGLWQCSKPCHKRTYDNKDKIVKMVLAQGFSIGEDGELIPPMQENGETDFSKLSMTVPSDLVPYCPVCGEPMSMNLRADNTFVEDEGWQEAADNYTRFLNICENQHVLFLELGVGSNTPGIIKYAFQNFTAENVLATYACVNYGEAYAPEEIADRSIVINGDAWEIIANLLQ